MYVLRQIRVQIILKGDVDEKSITKAELRQLVKPCFTDDAELAFF